jgi:predicted methyltransferase
VIEIAGFGQYYTTLLSAIVGGDGEVHVFYLPYTEARSGAASRAFAAAHPNTTYNVVDYNAAVFPDDVDIVFNVLYYHDLILNDIDTAAMNAKLFAALKPGGRYVVIDHKAEDGSGWRDAESLHRMGAEKIVEEVTAAGFVLSVDSDLLANPADPRTAMVFAPGTRGTTDQAFFIFTKPE